jgi:pSer/pThr/pTyr-binding forkhead associated (FHA) protein
VVQHRALDTDKAADSGFRARALTSYALREGQLEHRLSKSPVVLGRGTGADIVLAGPLVSRRHAELADTPHGLVVTDLGSRNGVFVNGHRITSPVVLEAGDSLAIGDSTFALVAVEEPAARNRATISETKGLRESERMPVGTYVDDEVSVATRRADALQLLGSVVDKALALGRGEEAEHLIGSHLVAALSDAATGRGVAPEVARAAAQYAVKLAAATSKPGWLDFAFRLYAALGATMPLPIVDEMFTVLRRVRGLDRELLHAYAEQQRSRADLSPPERFVLQRLEGLERLAAWHPPV